MLPLPLPLPLLLHALMASATGSEFQEIDQHESRLMTHLFQHSGYNRLIRPVSDKNQTVAIDFGLAMIQLINVEEKRQIMKSNVWLRMGWSDYQLRWDPADFGGVRVIRVNPKWIWQPDIVLYNNADGKYEVSWQPNILVFSNGRIMWIPPAIYQSSCTIHVKYFPFDEQKCEMKFGSWTFDANQVILGWYEGATTVDLSDYWKSGSWDIVSCPGNVTVMQKEGLPPQTVMTYTFTIRRKTLFYTVNLIIPCVLISLLSICVFYLPADAGEKMTMCILILLAQVVFLLLVSKILPATSISIPLISKFLLFTFIMNIITIVVTVVIINWNFRTPRTHKMPEIVRKIFLEFLPRILLMRRPEHVDTEEKRSSEMQRMADADCNGLVRFDSEPGAMQRQLGTDNNEEDRLGESEMQRQQQMLQQKLLPGLQVTKELRKAIAAINFISTHLRIEDEYKRILQDWKYVASVIDRIQLVIFTCVTLTGTVTILINAPSVLEFVDQDEILKKFAEQS